MSNLWKITQLISLISISSHVQAYSSHHRSLLLFSIYFAYLVLFSEFLLLCLCLINSFTTYIKVDFIACWCYFLVYNFVIVCVFVAFFLFLDFKGDIYFLEVECENWVICDKFQFNRFIDIRISQNIFINFMNNANLNEDAWI